MQKSVICANSQMFTYKTLIIWTNNEMKYLSGAIVALPGFQICLATKHNG